jgi:hypothetical protein
MSIAIANLGLITHLKQTQWLEEDSKTGNFTVKTQGWIINRRPGFDGALVQKIVDQALTELDNAAVRDAFSGIPAALDRRQSRALDLENTTEHTLFYQLKERVKGVLKDLERGVLVPAVGGVSSQGPIRLNPVKTALRTVKLCFSPNAESPDSLLSELARRVTKAPEHVPSAAVYAPRQIAAKPEKQEKVGSPPTLPELLAARGNLRRPDASCNQEFFRLASIEV